MRVKIKAKSKLHPFVLKLNRDETIALRRICAIADTVKLNKDTQEICNALYIVLYNVTKGHMK